MTGSYNIVHIQIKGVMYHFWGVHQWVLHGSHCSLREKKKNRPNGLRKEQFCSLNGH